MAPAGRSFDFLVGLRDFLAMEEEINGISAHEDGNRITFVIQDNVGASRSSRTATGYLWSPSTAAEVIQVLSKGKLKSATHGVVRKPVHKQLFAFFLNIHTDTVISGSSRCRSSRPRSARRHATWAKIEPLPRVAHRERRLGVLDRSGLGLLLVRQREVRSRQLERACHELGRHTLWLTARKKSCVRHASCTAASTNLRPRPRRRVPGGGGEA
jgi:hypothetical protein